jgi:uncharacterized protein
VKIFITAKPASKHEYIKQLTENHYEVAVKEPPIQGQANQAIIKALAKHFNVPPSSVTITSGHTSRNKQIEIQL